MLRSVLLHGDAIRAEIAVFDARRNEDSVRWGRLCAIKSLLSPGTRLDVNIAMARLMYDALSLDSTLTTYEDMEVYRSACRYGGRCVGRNIKNVLIAWPMLRTMLDISTLAARDMAGYGLKCRSWSMAMYDARSRVFTLDCHMIRRISAMAGVGDNVTLITDTVYPIVAEVLLELCEELRIDAPLVAQWAIWNEARHPGVHASIVALA